MECASTFSWLCDRSNRSHGILGIQYQLRSLNLVFRHTWGPVTLPLIAEFQTCCSFVFWAGWGSPSRSIIKISTDI